MKVLISGSSGFIGSNLTLRCLEEGWGVIGVDNDWNHIRQSPEEVQSVTSCLDLASDASLDQVKKQRYDVIFHEAAIPRVIFG